MYRKFRLVIIFSLAIILVGLAFPFSAAMNNVVGGVDGYAPYLSASITNPPNGTTFQVGNCFTVTAVITATCPTVLNNDWLIKPVFASIPISGVTATISITGNAGLAGGQTAQKLIGGMDCGGQSIVNWTVCCLGKGPVTITVTPAGYGYVTSLPDENPSRFIKPVYADGAVVPIPADHITSATITVFQVEPMSLLKDDAQPGGAGPGAQTWAMPADNRVTSIFIQKGQVLAGEPVRIMANVSNKGDLPGSYTATLTINNQVEATKKVTVPGGASIPVEFTVSREKPGNYEAEVNGQKVYFTVTGQATNNTANINLIVAIFLGVLILVAIILLIRRLATR